MRAYLLPLTLFVLGSIAAECCGQTVAVNGRILTPAASGVWQASYTSNGRTERVEARVWQDDQFWHVSGFDTGVSSLAFSKSGRLPLSGSHVLTNPKYVQQGGSWQTVRTYYDWMGTWQPWDVGLFVPDGTVTNWKALSLTVTP